MSIFNDEIQGQRAPEHLQRFATRFGGTTPYGNPRYRVVWAPSVRHKAEGEFYEWDEDLPVNDRGGIVLTEDGWEKNPISPLKVVNEVRWIQTYPDMEGWLIERWYPPHMFNKAFWERYRLLGPFPEQGRYVDCCKPIRNTPTLKQIEGVIQAIEYKIANKQGTMEQRIKQRTEQIMLEKEKKRLKIREMTKDILHERTLPLMGSSLEAGRMREEVANRLRARGVHMGHVGN